MPDSCAAPMLVADAPDLTERVAAVASGDRAALADLFDRCADRVYSVALRLLRQVEDSEEVVSDVFLQAWREASRFDPARGSVQSWLMRMAHSRAIDRLRRRRARPDQALAVALDEVTHAQEGGEDASFALLDLYQTGSAMHRALQRLGEEQRQLIGLAFTQGLSHLEIAAHTGLPLGTVKSHLRRGLLALRKHLQESGYEHA